jgi:type II restriction/modification system DNA methylase subunit YeeA
MHEEEAALYELPFEYIQAHVKNERLTNNRESYKTKWWIHAEPRPALRKAIAGLRRFVMTPRVAKYRIFVWAENTWIPDSRVFVFARDDDYFFGSLHSSAHEIWSLATCSWHGVGNGPTYNGESCFETFPFPWPPGTEPSESDDNRVKAIADAARDLVRLRDNWLNPPDIAPEELKNRTLTNLYNKHPEWLANAHRTLNEAVFAAYGWPASLTRDEILARLLALNHQRAAAQPARS